MTALTISGLHPARLSQMADTPVQLSLQPKEKLRRLKVMNGRAGTVFFSGSSCK